MLNISVRNVTRGTTLADRVTVADTSAERRKGLLGRNSLDRCEGLWIAPCEAVHTIGMRFPIDVLFLSRDTKVLKIRHAMASWRLAGCLRAHSVLELPAGTAEATQTQPGDRLEITDAKRDYQVKLSLL